MTNIVTGAVAACAGAIALTSAVQPASAADITVSHQYRPAPIEERYVYREPPPVYVPRPPADVYYEPAPPVVVVPEPYDGPRRRVYVYPEHDVDGYGPDVDDYGPYVARGYGYRRDWDDGPRRW